MIVFWLIAGAALIALFVWGVYAASYGEPKKRSERWAQTAAELGFELEPWQTRHAVGALYRKAPSFKQRMLGRRGEFAITCGVRQVHENDGVATFTFVQLTLPRPLGVGLRLARTSSLGRLWSTVAAPTDIETGVEALDRRFEIHGAQPDRVALLLRTPYVLEGLLTIAASRFDLTLEDHMVRLEKRGAEIEHGVLAPTIDSAVALGERLLAARAELGESTYDAQIGAVMQAVARDLSLEFDAKKIGVLGRLEGMHVEAFGAREGRRRVTHFVVRFDRALGLSLALSRQTKMSRLGNLLGAEDIETGDETFDARFVIKGAPEDAVRAALDPEVRRRLSKLQDIAEDLRVEDDRIVARVGYPMLEAEALRRGLHAVAGAGGALAKVTPHEIGPFRS